VPELLRDRRSSLGSSFNYDFHVSIDPDVAPVEYNYRDQRELEASDVDWKDWIGEQPGMSGFVLDDGKAFHAYSAYARGFDALWGAYPWLDRAPLGRNEDGYWWRRRFRARAQPGGVTKDHTPNHCSAP
jgi:predicted dithiol-disulfide oxidoreductase (DUF899 family)